MLQNTCKYLLEHCISVVAIPRDPKEMMLFLMEDLIKSGDVAKLIAVVLSQPRNVKYVEGYPYPEGKHDKYF